MRDLTVWITPFTNLGSLDEAIQTTTALANSVGAAPSLLLPTHFGRWPQSQCRQSLPDDMRVSSPDDIADIRRRVEDAGVGFGAWGVPVDLASAELAAAFAHAAGYYGNNIEPGEFWVLGDSPGAVDKWWETFWNSLPDPEALSGNVLATVIPNTWGLSSFRRSLPNIAGGCGLLAAEVYGGINTAAQYPAPGLWPTPSFAKLRSLNIDANLIAILARANLQAQFNLGVRLGHGNVHLWCI